MNTDDSDLPLRTRVMKGLPNPDEKRRIRGVYFCDDSPSLLVEVDSNGNNLGHMIDEMVAVAKGTDQTDLKVMVHHSRGTNGHAIGRLSMDRDVSDMSDEEIRVWVAHNIETE